MNEFKIKNGYLSEGNSQITGSLNVSAGITGSLFGTASFAITASHALNLSPTATASYALNALSASYAANGGVTQLLAGPNVILSPTNGLGQVTVTATLSGSNSYNTSTGSYGSFYDTTTQTNPVANVARSMSFNSTDITNGVSISGSTSPFNTYIKTENAGVYDIQFSAQVDKTDSGTDEIVIWLRKNGTDLTDSATTLTLNGNNDKQVAAWNWFVSSATGDYYQIIWRSLDTDLRLLAEPISGTHPGIPSVIATVNRVDQFLSNTGSFSGSFAGTLTGSFSGSGNITSASYAATASYVQNAQSASYVLQAVSASYATQALSASYSQTSSYLNTLNQDLTFNGNLTLNGTASITYLNVSYESASVIYSSGSNQFGDASNDTQTLWGTIDIKSGPVLVTGSVIANSFTGSLLGTASYATQALSASHATSTAAVAGTTNYVSKFTSGTTIGNSVIYDDGTNVGIGTASPVTKLEVDGTVTISGPSAIKWKYSDNYAYFGIGYISGADYGFYNYNYGRADLYIQQSSGNIGIGTTSPSYKLDVNASSSSDGLRVGVGGASRFIIYGDGVATWGPTANVGVLTWDTGKAIIMGQSGAALSLGSNGSWDKIYLTTAGDVGIGTTTPSVKLQVETSVNGSDGIWARNTNTGTSAYGTVIANSSVGGLGLRAHAAAHGVWPNTSMLSSDTGFTNGLVLFQDGANPIAFWTNSTERMRIASNGALKFNAYGSGTFTGTATQKLAVDSSGNLIEIPIGSGPVDGSGTANYITRWSDSDTITTSSIYETGGNIGIGTTSPGSLLQVGSASGTTDALVRLGINYDTSRSSRGGITWYDGGNTTGKIYTEYDGTMVSMVFGSLYNSGYNSNNLMIIRGNGNVGIGTITPAYKLSVVGKIALNDGGNSLFIGDNAGLSDDATANVNIGIGSNSLQNNVSGSNNVAIGYNTLVSHIGSFATAIGASALQNNLNNVNNTAVGASSLNLNTVGGSNTGVGTATLLSNTSGSRNTAVGSSASRLNTSGSRNTSIGVAALHENLLGNNNIAIGDNSARYFGSGTSALTDTSGSIIIGSNARANANGSLNEIVIGTDLIGLGSNTVVLGNDNVTTTALKGNVGIGTTTPSVKLHVSGAISASIFYPSNAGGNYIQGDGSGLVIGGSSYFYSNGSGGSYFEGNVRIRGGLSNDTAAYMQINGGTSGITYINGDLGVGISNPSPLLSATERVIEISNSNVASLYLNSTTGRRWSVSSISNGSLTFWDLGIAGGAERIRIDTSGNVGIGTTTPSYLLDVNGTARVTTLIETSAAKYKTNIQPLEPQLSKVTQLEPVTFDWLDKPNHKTNIGLIADEVEKIYPEFVSKTEDGEIEGIEYSKLTTVLIQSIKELKEIVDKQQAQINTLLNK